MTTRAVRGVATLSAAVCAVFTVTALAAADDFWLVPNAFHVASGARVDIRGQTSSKFPTSKSAVAPERVADARLLGASGAERIRHLSISGTSLVLRHRPTRSGQRVVVVRLHPRSVRESSEGFRRYLELEGASDALARVDRDGLLLGRDSVTRRYAKYAKTLVQVGRGGARAFDRRADYPLEFVPENDPATLAVGDTLRIRLLSQGAPLAGIRVHHDDVAWMGARTAAASPASTAEPAHAAPELAEHLVTDTSGVLRLVVTRPGLWNVRTVHVVPAAPESGADWDTHWASLVFLVGARGEAR